MFESIVKNIGMDEKVWLIFAKKEEESVLRYRERRRKKWKVRHLLSLSMFIEQTRKRGKILTIWNSNVSNFVFFGKRDEKDFLFSK